jgi:glyoxylase-like metal-dependent hydrolase (beta-lactamase superfamily II)
LEDAVDPTYEVLALRYATTDPGRPRRENFMPGMDLHDGPMPLDYYIWVIRGHGRVVVVDTGFGEVAAKERGRTLRHDPVALLDRIGVDAATVSDVILTHLHYDHAGSLDAFPVATFHLQDEEMRYATGRPMCHACLRAPFNVRDVLEAVGLVHSGRVRFHDGSATLFPGISVHRVGGHTGGLQVVRVATARGPLVPPMPSTSPRTAGGALRFHSSTMSARCSKDTGSARNWRMAARICSSPDMTPTCASAGRN